MIVAKDVFLQYPDGTQALKDINLHIQAGEIVYVTGPSGSGKTSLLKLIMGMEHPTLGSLQVLKQQINPNQIANIRRLRRRIGPVFQDFRLIKGRTALENVMLGMRFLPLPFGQLKKDANIALERVGLAHKTQSLVENLSWGEYQRVAIARAVARKPALILADEPTGNLDKDNALKILRLLISFKDKDTTIIITTHSTHLIEGKAGDVLIQMDAGNLHCERLGDENETYAI